MYKEQTTESIKYKLNEKTELAKTMDKVRLEYTRYIPRGTAIDLLNSQTFSNRMNDTIRKEHYRKLKQLVSHNFIGRYDYDLFHLGHNMNHLSSLFEESKTSWIISHRQFTLRAESSFIPSSNRKFIVRISC